MYYIHENVYSAKCKQRQKQDTHIQFNGTQYKNEEKDREKERLCAGCVIFDECIRINNT